MAERSLAVNRTSATSRRAARYMGGSTQFNGSTSTIPTTLTDNTAFTSGFVLHGWVYPTKKGVANGIFDKSDTSTATNGFRFHTFNDSVFLRVNDGTTVGAATGSIKQLTWQHVIAHIASDATVSFYINGVLSGTPATTGAPSGITTINPLTIGNRSTAIDRTFNGMLAELGIISLAGRSDITADEITALYTNSTRPTGAAHFWKLDEQPSTYTDMIGGKTGTGTATAFVAETPVQARVAVRDMGTALLFTGGDTDNVDTGVNVLTNIPSSHTISIWAKPRANGASAAPLYEADPSGGDRFYLQQRTSAPTSLTIGLSSWNVELANVVELNKWQHYTVVLNGTTGYFYRNGILRATQSGITVSIPNSSLIIGNNSAKNISFFGILDEPRIWNRALSATEIQNLYLYGAVPQDGLVAEYLFDEATGTTALDTSGNGNDGTITGATYTTDVPLQPRTGV